MSMTDIGQTNGNELLVFIGSGDEFSGRFGYVLCRRMWMSLCMIYVRRFTAWLFLSLFISLFSHPIFEGHAVDINHSTYIFCCFWCWYHAIGGISVSVSITYSSAHNWNKFEFMTIFLVQLDFRLCSCQYIVCVCAFGLVRHHQTESTKRFHVERCRRVDEQRKKHFMKWKYYFSWTKLRSKGGECKTKHINRTRRKNDTHKNTQMGWATENRTQQKSGREENVRGVRTKF